MEKYCGKEDRINVVNVPQWAQTLIDLYTSALKYEVKNETSINNPRK